MPLVDDLESLVIDVPDFPKPGIVFKDIAPIFNNPAVVSKAVYEICDKVKAWDVEAIAGVESRGFLFGVPLSLALQVPFIPIRKAGKLPGKTYAQSYDLEYGTATIEMQQNAIKKGQRVLIHDDVLATGGTAKATTQLIEKVGEVAGYSFIMDLEFLNGKEILSQTTSNFHSLLSY